MTQPRSPPLCCPGARRTATPLSALLAVAPFAGILSLTVQALRSYLTASRMLTDKCCSHPSPPTPPHLCRRYRVADGGELLRGLRLGKFLGAGMQVRTRGPLSGVGMGGQVWWAH